MALQVGIVRGLTGHFPGFAREGIDLWLHWCHNRVMGVYVKPGPDETSSVRAVSPLFPGLLCFALHALLVLAGLSALHPWSQVTYLYEAGWSVSNWDLAPDDLPASLQNWEGVRPDAHKARFFLMWPFMALADTLGMQTSEVLSAVKPVLAGVTVWASARVIRAQTGKLCLICGTALLPLTLLMVVMDGRLVFALCGYALLISVFLAGKIRPLIASLLCLLAIWLTSVTSGTFWCATLTLALLTLLALREPGGLRARPGAVLPLFAVLIVFSGGLFDALAKVTEYYGGAANLLSGAVGHGPVQSFTSEVSFVLALVLAAALCGVALLLLVKLCRRSTYTPLYLVTALPLVTGLAGFSIRVRSAGSLSRVRAVFAARLSGSN